MEFKDAVAIYAKCRESGWNVYCVRDKCPLRAMFLDTEDFTWTFCEVLERLEDDIKELKDVR